MTLWMLVWALLAVGPAMAAEPEGEKLDGAPLLAAYDEVRAQLAADHASEAAAGARSLADRAPDEATAAAAVAVSEAPDLDAMRRAFADLSRVLVLRFATSPPEGLRVYQCPMAPAYPYWLQDEAGLVNPYMGTSMPGCGQGTSLRAAAKAAASWK
jgi:hypothetical protein